MKQPTKLSVGEYVDALTKLPTTSKVTKYMVGDEWDNVDTIIQVEVMSLIPPQAKAYTVGKLVVSIED